MAFIVFNQLHSETNAFDFSSDLLNQVVGTSLCSLMSLQELDVCKNKFEKEMKSSETANDQYNERGICCAINHLKDCINNAIGDQCGENQKKESETIVTAVISGFKKVAIPDNCQQYPYGSPLCYSDLTLILIVIGFVVLFVFSICLTVKLCCCCCCRSSPEKKMFILPNVVSNPGGYKKFSIVSS